MLQKKRNKKRNKKKKNLQNIKDFKRPNLSAIKPIKILPKNSPRKTILIKNAACVLEKFKSDLAQFATNIINDSSYVYKDKLEEERIEEKRRVRKRNNKLKKKNE